MGLDPSVGLAQRRVQEKQPCLAAALDKLVHLHHELLRVEPRVVLRRRQQRLVLAGGVAGRSRALLDGWQRAVIRDVVRQLGAV